MYQFDYQRPRSVSAAAELLRQLPEPKLLAGGMTLIPTLKLRLAQPGALIDLSGIEALKGIEKDGAQILIGAMTRHADVASSAIVRGAIPALASLAGGIGDTQVRHRGTIGGSISNNDPAADYPAACLGLGATIVTNRRDVCAEDFFTGMFSTCLEFDELVVAVRFPIPRQAAYVKFRNVATGYANAGVMVANGQSGVRVAVTGAGQSGVFRATEIEQRLAAQWHADALREIALPAEDMNSDLHASAEYRAHLVAVLARRAVTASQEGASR